MTITHIARFPRPVQTTLKRVRAAIRKAIPGAEETILRHSRVPLPGPRRHLFRRLETALLDLSRQRPPRRRVQEELEPRGQ